MGFIGFLNRLWQCLFIWWLKPSKNFAINKCPYIIVQSFGDGKVTAFDHTGIDLHAHFHGLSNMQIVHWIADLVSKNIFTSEQLICQWEITEGLKLHGIQPRRSVTMPQGKHYLTTEEVLKIGLIDVLPTKVLIVGHRHHVPRIAWHLIKMGYIPIIPDGLKTISYDSHSTQWWTRNLFLWVIREIPTRLYFLFTGKI